jgi:hypothetical protein
VKIADRSLHRTVFMGWRKSSARQEAFLDMAEFFRRVARSIPEIAHIDAPS